MGLTFQCPFCDETHQIESHVVPDVKVKYRNLEHPCRTCGATSRGMTPPDACPECKDNHWGEPEQVVTGSQRVQMCPECQEKHGLEL
jgi:hypothetical protein